MMYQKVDYAERPAAKLAVEKAIQTAHDVLVDDGTGSSGVAAHGDLR